MKREEFMQFWGAVTMVYPKQFSEDNKVECSRLFKDLELSSSLRAIRTCTKRPEPPEPSYLAYLARECNGMPDLLYKAVKRIRDEQVQSQEDHR